MATATPTQTTKHEEPSQPQRNPTDQLQSTSSTAKETTDIQTKKRKKNVINVGTRRSELARRQTDIVVNALRDAWAGEKSREGLGRREGTALDRTAIGRSIVRSASGFEGGEDGRAVPSNAVDTAIGGGDDDDGGDGSGGEKLEFIIHAMSTAGDKNQVTALHEFGAKALWTQELEVGLLEGGLDMVVHSLKDMPTQLPATLTIGAIFPREDPRDALVLREPPSGSNPITNTTLSSSTDNNAPVPTASSTSPSPSPSKPAQSAHSILTSLPHGSIIGTSSVRRIAQLKRRYPHLAFADVRGNVHTRLAKLDGRFNAAAPPPSSETTNIQKSDDHQASKTTYVDPSQPPPQAIQPDYAALILATAGLTRLGLSHRISAPLSSSDANADTAILHAVGQGALAVEIREGDVQMETLLARVGCERTTRACLAERSLLRVLEGGCSVPIGVETVWGGGGGGVDGKDGEDGNDVLTLHAAVLSTDGVDAVDARASMCIKSRDDADALGREVARVLVERGADKILERITLDRGVVARQGGA